MPEVLPPPDRATLSRAPLGLVACQVNFSEIDRRLASKEVFKYRDRLNSGPGPYGELTQIRKNQVTLQVNAFGGASTSEASSTLGWRLATRDQAWSVALFSDSVVLECRSYEGWQGSFRTRLEDALAGAIEAFTPEVETRLGLRYVNVFSNEEATSPRYWQGKIQQPFLGPLSSEALSPYFTGSAQRVTFAFDDVNVALALSFQPDAVFQGCTAVLFDIDVFRQGAREFRLETAIATADSLNTRALQLFQSIVAPIYRGELL